MDAINKFFESELGLTIVVAILVVTIFAFIVFIIKKNRNKIGYLNSRNYNRDIIELPKKQNFEDDDMQSVRLIKNEEVSKSNNMLPDVPVANEVKKTSSLPTVPVEETIVEEVKEEPIEEQVSNQPVVQVEVPDIDTGDLPLVDIPIQKMEDTPIFIEESGDAVVENITNDTPITIEESAPFVEGETSSEEIISIETSLEMPSETPLNIAFNSEATAINKIDEEIEIEEPHEYVSEKTEIFEFPDFNGLNGNDSNNITFKQLDNGEAIEKEILEAANSFIDKVMTK